MSFHNLLAIMLVYVSFKLAEAAALAILASSATVAAALWRKDNNRSCRDGGEEACAGG